MLLVSEDIDDEPLTIADQVAVSSGGLSMFNKLMLFGAIAAVVALFVRTRPRSDLGKQKSMA
jgi:hypothetical protein